MLFRSHTHAHTHMHTHTYAFFSVTNLLLMSCKNTHAHTHTHTLCVSGREVGSRAVKTRQKMGSLSAISLYIYMCSSSPSLLLLSPPLSSLHPPPLPPPDLTGVSSVWFHPSMLPQCWLRAHLCVRDPLWCVCVCLTMCTSVCVCVCVCRDLPLSSALRERCIISISTQAGLELLSPQSYVNSTVSFINLSFPCPPSC